jgi:hypothetical protein
VLSVSTSISFGGATGVSDGSFIWYTDDKYSAPDHIDGIRGLLS